MMRKFALAITIVCSAAGLACAQNTFQNFAMDVQALKAREARPELAYKTIQGSPYYSDDFIKGYVYLANGDSARVPLRHDLYMDEIEFMQNDKTMWLNKNNVDSVLYDDKKLIRAAMGDQPDLHYFFVATEGTSSLLWRQQIDFLRAEPLRGFAEPKPNRFEPASKAYFIKNKGASPVSIRTRRDLREFASDDARALEFLKKEKIKPGREDDLIKFVEFLNSRQ